MAKNILVPWTCPDCGQERLIRKCQVKARPFHGRCRKCYLADPKRKHGKTGTQLHTLWCQIIDRCHRVSHPSFTNYGGRGIAMSAEWRSNFDTFEADILATIGPRPSAQHSLDRIDNSGNYENGNVRWATRTEQNSNTRRNRLLTVGQKTMTLQQWADETAINYGTLLSRVTKLGWSAESALIKPVRRLKRSNPDR